MFSSSPQKSWLTCILTTELYQKELILIIFFFSIVKLSLWQELILDLKNLFTGTKPCYKYKCTYPERCFRSGGKRIKTISLDLVNLAFPIVALILVQYIVDFDGCSRKIGWIINSSYIYPIGRNMSFV